MVLWIIFLFLKSKFSSTPYSPGSLPFPLPEATIVTNMYVCIFLDILCLCNFLKIHIWYHSIQSFLVLILQHIWIPVELPHSSEAKINILIHIYLCIYAALSDKIPRSGIARSKRDTCKADTYCKLFETRKIHFSFFSQSASNPSANLLPSYVQNVTAS